MPFLSFKLNSSLGQLYPIHPQLVTSICQSEIQFKHYKLCMITAYRKVHKYLHPHSQVYLLCPLSFNLISNICIPRLHGITVT